MIDLSQAKNLLGEGDRQKLDAALSSISALRGKISRLAVPEGDFSALERKVQRLQGEVRGLTKELDAKRRILADEDIRLSELRQPFRESVAEIDTALKEIGDLFAGLISRYQVHVHGTMIVAALSTWKREFDRVQKEFKDAYGRYL